MMSFEEAAHRAASSKAVLFWSTLKPLISSTRTSKRHIFACSKLTGFRKMAEVLAESHTES